MSPMSEREYVETLRKALEEIQSMAADSGYMRGDAAIHEVARAALAVPMPVAAGPFQSGAERWGVECFGAERMADKRVPAGRFLQEALELAQAGQLTQKDCLVLVGYVYSRPIGEVSQEVGSAMVSLAALCVANGIDMQQAGETELLRVQGKIDVIRAKQAAKDKLIPTSAPAARMLAEPPESLLRIAELESRNLNLRKRIHNSEYHNQFFERCENAYCRPSEGRFGDPALEPHGDAYAMTRIHDLERQLAEAAVVARQLAVAAEPEREWAVVWEVLRGPDVWVEIRKMRGSKVAAESELSHWNTVRDQIRTRRCHLESRIPAGPWEPECLEEKS